MDNVLRIGDRQNDKKLFRADVVLEDIAPRALTVSLKSR